MCEDKRGGNWAASRESVSRGLPYCLYQRATLRWDKRGSIRALCTGAGIGTTAQTQLLLSCSMHGCEGPDSDPLYWQFGSIQGSLVQFTLANAQPESQVRLIRDKACYPTMQMFNSVLKSVHHHAVMLLNPGLKQQQGAVKRLSDKSQVTLVSTYVVVTKVGQG